MSDRTSPSRLKMSAHDTTPFENVHTFVSTIGFNRSGSSLVGSLLTAHRNMIVAHEPRQRRPISIFKIDPLVLFYFLLVRDTERNRTIKKCIENSEKSLSLNKSEFKTRYYTRNKYMIVPNQWQARYESLQVIGIKDSPCIQKQLLKAGMLKTFRENLKKESVSCLKFIFMVRNPYDLISSDTIHYAQTNYLRKLTQDNMNKSLCNLMRKFHRKCRIVKYPFTVIKAEDIFINRHEDMVASPVDQLSKLCDFLGVPALPDYLNDCASVVDKKANKSRYELDWSEQQKEEVAKLIDKYHFLSGYSWDS